MRLRAFRVALSFFCFFNAIFLTGNASALDVRPMAIVQVGEYQSEGIGVGQHQDAKTNFEGVTQNGAIWSTISMTITKNNGYGDHNKHYVGLANVSRVTSSGSASEDQISVRVRFFFIANRSYFVDSIDVDGNVYRDHYVPGQRLGAARALVTVKFECIQTDACPDLRLADTATKTRLIEAAIRYVEDGTQQVVSLVSIFL